MENLPRVVSKGERTFGIKPSEYNSEYNIVVYFELENGTGWVTELKKQTAEPILWLMV